VPHKDSRTGLLTFLNDGKPSTGNLPEKQRQFVSRESLGFGRCLAGRNDNRVTRDSILREANLRFRAEFDGLRKCRRREQQGDEDCEGRCFNSGVPPLLMRRRFDFTRTKS
jgi:hypothetical protein